MKKTIRIVVTGKTPGYSDDEYGVLIDQLRFTINKYKKGLPHINIEVKD